MTKKVKKAKKVQTQLKGMNVEVDTKQAKFREKLGAVWMKKVGKGKSKGTDRLSISLMGKNYQAFRNSRPKTGKSPDYWVYEYTKNGSEVERKQIGCVYNGVSRKGDINMLWLLMEQRFIALPNPFKTEDKHPDYLIYLAYRQPAQKFRSVRTWKAKAAK